MKLKKRILLSAFECNPFVGSDAEVGWQWARQLSRRNFNVTVLTRKTHQVDIEKAIAETGDCAQVRFIYVDMRWLYRITELINPRNHLYYYFWQLRAFFAAYSLHRQQAFNLIHHVTWVSFRQPSLMGFVGAPMYFGPVAGGDEIPHGYTRSFAFKQRAVEFFRGLLNSAVRFDPLMWLTYASANKIFFTSNAHLARVPSYVQHKAKIELAIGCDVSDVSSAPKQIPKPISKPRRGNRLLFVGRFLGLKGMDIGLEIFERIRQVRPDVTLTIIGDGEEHQRWKDKAVTLGVDHAIEWLGWLAKADVLKLYAEFDVFFFPSLRDSGGFVILEALQQGLPVVCFKLGGPGVIVNESCGVAVEATAEIEQTISTYADAVLRVLDTAKNDDQLPVRCKQRAHFFEWDALIKRLYQDVE
jgi:glycosyltransferase involved in cell wall biosynthesis